MLNWLRRHWRQIANTTLVVAAFWAGILLAQRPPAVIVIHTSQPPIPSAAKISQPKQTPANQNADDGRDQRQGTEQAPFVVKTISTPETQAEANNDAAYQQAKATDEHVIELGIAGLIISVLQAIALVATFWIMRKTAIRQLRAYLSVRPNRMMDLRIGKLSEADFFIENKGQTPAYNVAYLATVRILPHPLVDNQGDLLKPNKEEKVPDIVVHAGGHLKCEAIDSDPLTQADLANALSSKEHRLYIFGVVTYTDIFRIRRKTKFCAYIDQPDLARIIAIGKIPTQIRPAEVPMDWIFSHVHNDAD